MQTDMDWTLDLTLDQVVDWVRRQGREPRDEVVNAYRQAMGLAEGLVEPRTAYVQLDIQSIIGREVTLEDGSVLTSGELADRLDGADAVGILCWTLGPALENKARDLMAGGDLLLGYALDTYGALALGNLGRNLYEERRDALPENQAATLPLSPGQLDWGIGDQSTVTRLVGANELGVTLTASLMMQPLKSCTSLFGIGPAGSIKEGQVACEKCPRRFYCDYSHAESGREADGL